MDGRAGRGAAAVKRALLGLALLAGTCVPALADYNVSGRFVFVDREFDASGFTGVEPQLPIRFATVEVVDGTKIKGSGVTDANGNFLIHLVDTATRRSEEHTSELQSVAYLVCRLLLEKTKNTAQ